MLFLFLCLAFPSLAQLNSRDLVDCSGIIQPPDSGAAAIELDADGVPYHAEIDGTGYFHVSRIPSGEYRGRVLDSSGNLLETTSVTVGYSSATIVIRLSNYARPSNHRIVPGTVSVAVLQHKVPENARKELDLAEKAAKKKDTTTAIQHLRKAVTLDPEYLDAHNTLGMRYVQTSQYNLALTEFRRALEMDPRNATLQSNVAATLLALHQPAEAEIAARRAVDLNGASPRAHYLVALSAMAQGRRTAEVAKHLRVATEQIPTAHPHVCHSEYLGPKTATRLAGEACRRPPGLRFGPAQVLPGLQGVSQVRCSCSVAIRPF
jgi:hypothetical protein